MKQYNSGDGHQGWQASQAFMKERTFAFGRGWMEWPIIAIGGLVLSWCGLVVSLSGFSALGPWRLGAIFLLGVSAVICGIKFHRRENAIYAKRQAEFFSRWSSFNDAQISPPGEKDARR